MMIMAIVTFIGFVITAGLVTGLIEKHLNDGMSEFCKIECRKNRTIYK